MLPCILTRLNFHRTVSLGPVDRLLVAQAEMLPTHLLTTDDLLPRYSELVTRIALQ
jgi:PIN domain nuclease of toxin-antitoxin system